MSTPNLIEGRDYTIDAAGRLMFTAAYHLARGSCCGNGCWHCPYGNSPANHAASNADGPLPRPVETDGSAG